MKGQSLNWTKNNQWNECFKAWRKRVEMLKTGMALKKKPKELLSKCIKIRLGETGQVHLESVGFTGVMPAAQNTSWMS